MSEVIDPVHAGIAIDYEVRRAGGGDRLTLSVRRAPSLFDTRETARASEEQTKSAAEVDAFVARLVGEFGVFELRDSQPPFPFLHPTLYTFRFEDDRGAEHGFTYRVEAREHHDERCRRLVESFEEFFRSPLLEDFFSPGRTDPAPRPWWKFW